MLGVATARPQATSTLVPSAALSDRDLMADVIIGFKVMPKTIEVNLDKLEEKIKKAVNPARIQRQPIAFGLVAILITVLMPDEGGVLEAAENKLRAIDDVGEVEVTGMTRSL